jgi:hypothetical protein
MASRRTVTEACSSCCASERERAENGYKNTLKVEDAAKKYSCDSVYVFSADMPGNYRADKAFI